MNVITVITNNVTCNKFATCYGNKPCYKFSKNRRVNKDNFEIAPRKKQQDEEQVRIHPQ